MIYFTTFTVNGWISVFEDFPECSIFIINSLSYLSQVGKIKIYAFVIMRDHLHFVWEIIKPYTIEEITISFKKFTGSRISQYLKMRDEEYLEQNFSALRKDRIYKFWKINSGRLILKHPNIIKQKILYIHQNPTKGAYKTCSNPQNHFYSSAKLYKLGSSNFEFLHQYL